LIRLRYMKKQKTKIDKKLSDIEMRKIISLYEKTLSIPKRKLKEQFLLCPIGLMGSGKTTIIKLLAKKLFLVRISGDEIRELLNERGFDYDRVKEIGANVTKKYIERGFSVAIDADCVTKEVREYIEKFKNENKIKVFWIHINPPEKFIINNFKRPKPAWLFKEFKDIKEGYLYRKSLHKNIDLPFIYTFDPSRNDFNDQLNKSISIIRKKLGI